MKEHDPSCHTQRDHFRPNDTKARIRDEIKNWADISSWEGKEDDDFANLPKKQLYPGLEALSHGAKIQKWSRQSKPWPNVVRNYEPWSTCGLDNIGNTCYFNL